MAREMTRYGGRSARIQEAVHSAVKALIAEAGREALTVPVIAGRAGVPPSTIYRRWGDLSDLVADVATERMRPIADPEDTGSLRGDLEAWTVQYLEEMSTAIGRELLKDMFAAAGGDVYVQRCCVFTQGHLEVIRDRAIGRGEAAIDVEEAIDRIVAPIAYHILFIDRVIDEAYAQKQVRTYLAGLGA